MRTQLATRILAQPRATTALARWARRWAPWRTVVGALVAIAAIHALWAMGVWWPAKTSDGLAEVVVGRAPFPDSSLVWVIVGLLMAAVALIVGSMQKDLPPLLARACCFGALGVAFVLGLRGIFGEISSITGLEGATGQFRVLDILVFSPFCLWAALGIYYRDQPSDASTS